MGDAYSTFARMTTMCLPVGKNVEVNDKEQLVNETNKQLELYRKQLKGVNAHIEGSKRDAIKYAEKGEKGVALNKIRNKRLHEKHKAQIEDKINQLEQLKFTHDQLESDKTHASLLQSYNRHGRKLITDDFVQEVGDIADDMREFGDKAEEVTSAIGEAFSAGLYDGNDLEDKDLEDELNDILAADTCLPLSFDVAPVNKTFSDYAVFKEPAGFPSAIDLPLPDKKDFKIMPEPKMESSRDMRYTTQRTGIDGRPDTTALYME